MGILKSKSKTYHLGSEVGIIQILTTMRGLQHYQLSTIIYWLGSQNSFVLNWKPQLQAAVIATRGKTDKKTQPFYVKGFALRSKEGKKNKTKTL